jgi:hypothetical protein
MTRHNVLIATFRHERAEFTFLAVAVTFSIWRTYLLVDQALNVGRIRSAQVLKGIS